MWWRPEPSSVSPIYMPGRLRTASRPFSTLIDSAPYSAAASALRLEAGVMVSRRRLFALLTGFRTPRESGADLTPIHRKNLGVFCRWREQIPAGSGRCLRPKLRQKSPPRAPAVETQPPTVSGGVLEQQKCTGFAVAM